MADEHWFGFEAHKVMTVVELRILAIGRHNGIVMADDHLFRV